MEEIQEKTSVVNFDRTHNVCCGDLITDNGREYQQIKESDFGN